MITIAANSEGTKDQRVEKAFFIVEPSTAQLAEISRLFDASELRCVVDAVVPLNKASDAYCGRLEERKGRGKIVLSMENQPACRV
jgi:NADPH:quinone reductase-like Zn-dependent oxidoreductase